MRTAVAVGIFCTDVNVQYAAYPNSNDACASGEQFGVQVIGAVVISAWTIVTAGLTFLLVKYTIGMRVSEDIEVEGLDISEHGGAGYNDNIFKGNDVDQIVAQPVVMSDNKIQPMQVQYRE